MPTPRDTAVGKIVVSLDEPISLDEAARHREAAPREAQQHPASATSNCSVEHAEVDATPREAQQHLAPATSTSEVDIKLANKMDATDLMEKLISQNAAVNLRLLRHERWQTMWSMGMAVAMLATLGMTAFSLVRPVNQDPIQKIQNTTIPNGTVITASVQSVPLPNLTLVPHKNRRLLVNESFGPSTDEFVAPRDETIKSVDLMFAGVVPFHFHRSDSNSLHHLDILSAIVLDDEDEKDELSISLDGTSATFNMYIECAPGAKECRYVMPNLADEGGIRRLREAGRLTYAINKENSRQLRAARERSLAKQMLDDDSQLLDALDDDDDDDDNDFEDTQNSSFLIEDQDMADSGRRLWWIFTRRRRNQNNDDSWVQLLIGCGVTIAVGTWGKAGKVVSKVPGVPNLPLPTGDATPAVPWR